MTIYSPPVSTYTALATTTLSSATSSVTFSSIPASYRDLVLVINVPSLASATYCWLRMNSDSGSNYSRVIMEGNGSTAISQSASGNTEMYLHWNTVQNDFNIIAQIMDYSATDKHKTVLARANDASDLTTAAALRWASTSAITSVQISNLAGANYGVGSTFSLYGIEA